MRAWLATAGALLLAGCASLAPVPSPEDEGLTALWAEHQARLVPLSAFALEGRAAGSGLAGAKVDLQFRQQADGRFSMRVSGPFGAGAASLAGNEHTVEVRSREGSFVTDDPQAWLQERSGWSLPLRRLRWWLVGLPAPDGGTVRVQFDAEGRARTLEQDGWLLNYADYQTVAQWVLPRRLEARQGERQLRIVVDRWDIAPEPGS